MAERNRLSSPQTPKRIALALCVAWTSLVASSAWAGKDDRSQPINLSFERRGSVDIAAGRTEVVGNVVLTQGTTLLRAERAEVRETPGGFHQAWASGTASQQASVRQARDIPGEAVEGFADRLDYNTRADTVRLSGNARLRQMQQARVAKEISGAAIAYDRRADILAVEGGSPSPNPKGRARIVLMPPPLNAAEENEEAAGVASALKLQPTLTLGPQR